jgi:hypothetical protein
MNARAGQGEQIAGLSGLALILIMFLFAWYGFDAGNVEANGFDAFDAYSDWLNLILVFTGIAGICLGLYGAAAARLQLPISLSVLTAVLGALSALLILIFLISPPDFPSFGGEAVEVDLDRKIGVFLGLLAALGVAAGGYLAMQAEGTSFQDAADRLSGDRDREREERRRDRGGPGAPSEPPPASTEPRSTEPPPPPPPPSSGP